MDDDEATDPFGVHILERFPHGEGAGAYIVRTTTGDEGVLKRFAGAAAHDAQRADADLLVDCVRGRGYPAPFVQAGWRTDGGVAYELQERMPGAPVEQITAAHLASVRALIEMQRGAATESLAGHTFLDDLISTVLEGGNGYCEHDAMRAHSPATRALLDRLRAVAESARDARVPIRDVVHYDFSPYNILAEGDEITGVVDWGDARAGDASFDLVTLAFYTYDYAIRDELLEMTRGRTAPRALALYAAHMVLRQVDWSLRHHGPAESEWFMGVGDALLGRVAT